MKIETARINLANVELFLSEAAKVGPMACPKAVKRARANKLKLEVIIKNATFYTDMAREAGAEITQLSDGRWMVASCESAPIHAARVFKNCETAAQLWLCDTEVLKPIEG